MTTVKTDLTLVQIKWGKDSKKKDKVYTIKCESVKDTDKQDIEKVYACDSHEANYITFGKTEYSIDLSGVQSHRWLFQRMRERQTQGAFNYTYPTLVTFKYNEKGQPKIDNYYMHVFVEEMSGENQDPFDVKLIAMKRLYTDKNGNYF